MLIIKMFLLLFMTVFLTFGKDLFQFSDKIFKRHKFYPKLELFTS